MPSPKNSEHHAELAACLAQHYSGVLQVNLLAAQCELIKLESNHMLWQAHQHQQYLYILKSGLLYAWFETHEGKSFCKEAYWGNDLIFCFRSLLSDIPYPFSVRTVEPSYLFRLPRKHYLSLVAAHADWKAFHLSAIGEYYMYKEEKEAFLLLNSPEQRVVLFYQTYPDMVKRLPQHVIASYLGMTPISFSRIKKRLGLLTNVNATGVSTK